MYEKYSMNGMIYSKLQIYRSFLTRLSSTVLKYQNWLSRNWFAFQEEVVHKIVCHFKCNKWTTHMSESISWRAADTNVRVCLIFITLRRRIWWNECTFTRTCHLQFYIDLVVIWSIIKDTEIQRWCESIEKRLFTQTYHESHKQENCDEVARVNLQLEIGQGQRI